MTGRERRLIRILCMTAGGGGGGGDKPWEEMTWDDVIAATKNGKYKDFEIGAMKELDLGTEGIVHMQIVGIDVDDLADGSGKAPLTFISKELLKTSHRMNATNTNTGGWEASEMRAYLIETVKPLIPATVSAQIKSVKKYSYVRDPQNQNALTTDDVWIPSFGEVSNGTSYESSGPKYSGVYSTTGSRDKDATWWLRTADSNSSYFRNVTDGGSGGKKGANGAAGVALGFCL